jgi:hypothetical protein
MEIIWTDRVRNEEVLHIVKEGWSVLQKIKKTSQFLHPSEPCNMKIHIRYVLKFVHVTYPVAAATSLH